MRDLTFGLQMAAVGMGVVFGLLLGLMAILLLLGRLDPQPEPEPHPLEDAFDDEPALDPAPEPAAHGLDPERVAAITIAVLAHKEVRRRQAAPAMRTHQPGSHLYASRWLAIGRGQQIQPRRGR